MTPPPLIINSLYIIRLPPSFPSLHQARRHLTCRSSLTQAYNIADPLSGGTEQIQIKTRHPGTRRICCLYAEYAAYAVCCIPGTQHTWYTLHTSSADVICCIGCTGHPPPHGRNLLSSVKLAVTPVDPERTDNFVNLRRPRQMSWVV